MGYFQWWEKSCAYRLKESIPNCVGTSRYVVSSGLNILIDSVKIAGKEKKIVSADRASTVCDIKY